MKKIIDNTIDFLTWNLWGYKVHGTTTKRKVIGFFKSLIHRITKANWCYRCGKFIWWGQDTARVIESPKDELGVKVPVCPDCYFYFQEKDF